MPPIEIDLRQLSPSHSHWDKRAQFIGVDAYVAAGGAVLRDLFQGDDGGWLHDVALVDQMVADKLKTEADTIAAEDWKWIEVAPDFAYG